MEQSSQTWDVALWLLPSSVWPEVVELRSVDEWMLPFEVVQQMMQERKETYVYRAAMMVGFRSVQECWHIKRSYQKDVSVERVSVNEVVAQLWTLIEAEGIDPVEVSSQDALGVVSTEASSDPASLFARWQQLAMASDERALTDRWNDRRSALVRARLAQEEERVVV